MQKKYYPPKNNYPKLTIEHRRPETIIGVIAPIKLIRSLGGLTVVKLTLRKGVEITGKAYCWKLEPYNKRKGKSIALGRLLYALSALDFPDYVATKKWVVSKVGKVDKDLVKKAFHGEKIQ